MTATIGDVSVKASNANLAQKKERWWFAVGGASMKVRSIKVSQGGTPLFDAELDFSISENPTLRFHFVPQGPGELRAEVEDSKEARFEGLLALP